MLRHAGLACATLAAYEMDVELLFSAQPFGQVRILLFVYYLSRAVSEAPQPEKGHTLGTRAGVSIDFLGSAR